MNNFVLEITKKNKQGVWPTLCNDVIWASPPGKFPLNPKLIGISVYLLQFFYNRRNSIFQRCWSTDLSLSDRWLICLITLIHDRLYQVSIEGYSIEGYSILTLTLTLIITIIIILIIITIIIISFTVSRPFSSKLNHGYRRLLRNSIR